MSTAGKYFRSVKYDDGEQNNTNTVKTKTELIDIRNDHKECTWFSSLELNVFMYLFLMYILLFFIVLFLRLLL